MADSIDHFVHVEMARSKAPGVAILVIKDGRIVKRKGYGFANVEHRIPSNPFTVFESGSMGKQFTAALVLMLAQDKWFKLQDPIVKFFPEGAAKWGKVTVRQLLTHTSGIGDMPYDQMDMRKRYTEKDLVDLMAKQPMVESPGAKWRYNNGGYVLLGILVHRVTGKFYGDLLASRIFKPLGMYTARVISEHEIVMNRSSGYQLEDGKIVNQDWVSPSLNRTADGSLYLSIDDMKKWDAAMYRNKVLGSDIIAEMSRPTRLIDGSIAVVNPGDHYPVYYGMGWTISHKQGYTCIAHAGGWQGFRTYYARIAESKLSVVVMANLDSADTATIGKQILEFFQPKLRDGRLRADSRIP